MKDFAQAITNFFAKTHRKPTWRKRGQGEGFRIVAVKAGEVRRLSRHVGDVKVPKVGWVRFRWSRPVPEGVKLKAREADRRKDWVEKTSTDLARRFDVIAVEDLKVGDMTRSAKGTLEAPGRTVRHKAGLNRGIPAAGWGLLEHKARGRVRKIDPRGTSQTCNACKHTAREGRESQALRDNIKDTAVGHTVAARGGTPSGGPANREPQRDLLLVG
ncbi:hypothetical protein [Nonomuraea lactucae]|uniref:hypothetical protein n=1 Tax=Nonomuraea lactucae TaxID=2249762 RepID=UPI001964F2E2|nr:hypothetical protein [Nonomuraea lactucae]